MNDPDLSILLSVYNGRIYLPEAIESILEQTFADFELIIIDDGSQDGSWSIIQDYSIKDNRIIPIRCDENIGTSNALNKGLSISRGRYITRQDGDDISLNHRMAEQISYLEGHPDIAAAGTNVFYMDSAGNPLGVSDFPLTNSAVQKVLLDYMCFCGPTLMVRREFFQKAGFFFEENLSYSEDYDLCLRLAEIGELANLETPLYRYRQHSSSVSISKRSYQIRNKAIALENAIQRRFGEYPTDGQADRLEAYGYAARDFFRAAVLFSLDGQSFDEAQVCLKRALQYDPDLLQKKTVENVIAKNTQWKPIDQAVPDIQTIFDHLLPPSRNLSRLRARLLSELYFREVFEKTGQSQWDGVAPLFLEGLRHNPKWLLNRGVVAVGLKLLARRFQL